MKIASSCSVNSNTIEAVTDTYGKIRRELGCSPDLIVLYSSVTHDGDEIMQTMKELAPGIPLHGGTSCVGVMSDDGFFSEDGTGLGILGISDPDGNYGVGYHRIGDDPRSAGARAIEMAISNAGRAGELPELIWINGAPGTEELVLLGVMDVLGDSVPIAGGSTGDNTIEGKWQQFAGDGVFSDAVVLTAIYPSTKLHFSFHSGYSPTEITGTVTKADGRILSEIDGLPAAEVYNAWTKGSVSEFIEDGGNVLANTTMNPIGRIAGLEKGIAYYKLSHPERILPGGSMMLFSNIEVGDEIILMRGTKETLVNRAGRVAQSAISIGGITQNEIAGALMVYCAGCMLAVMDDMDTVASKVKDALDGSPYLGTFTFGEQGCFIGGENNHGNLMISVVVFEK